MKGDGANPPTRNCWVAIEYTAPDGSIAGCYAFVKKENQMKIFVHGERKPVVWREFEVLRWVEVQPLDSIREAFDE